MTQLGYMSYMKWSIVKALQRCKHSSNEACVNRYRASQLSQAADQPRGVAQEETLNEQHAESEEAGEEGDSDWDPMPEGPSSDTSSEFSDMPEILAGDPAEAAAARADGYAPLWLESHYSVVICMW